MDTVVLAHECIVKYLKYLKKHETQQAIVTAIENVKDSAPQAIVPFSLPKDTDLQTILDTPIDELYKSLTIHDMPNPSPTCTQSASTVVITDYTNSPYSTLLRNTIDSYMQYITNCVESMPSKDSTLLYSAIRSLDSDEVNETIIWGKYGISIEQYCMARYVLKHAVVR